MQIEEETQVTRTKHEPATTSVDVAIIGAGPVGLMIANTLGLYGVSVLLVEKLDKLIDYPRAIGLDDESLRTGCAS
jgi:3-(3-hydroxy-phenyl)propionate hydroxylase